MEFGACMNLEFKKDDEMKSLDLNLVLSLTCQDSSAVDVLTESAVGKHWLSYWVVAWVFGCRLLTIRRPAIFRDIEVINNFHVLKIRSRIIEYVGQKNHAQRFTLQVQPCRRTRHSILSSRTLDTTYSTHRARIDDLRRESRWRSKSSKINGIRAAKLSLLMDDTETQFSYRRCWVTFVVLLVAIRSISLKVKLYSEWRKR